MPQEDNVPESSETDEPAHFRPGPNERTKREKSAHEKEQREKDDGGDKGKKGPGKKPLVILAVVIILIIIAALIWWFATRNQVTTDDAYTDGNAVTMAPKVSGYVDKLLVNDNTHVHKGDVLVVIDQRDYIAARDKAVAALALAQAQLQSAQVDLAIAKVQYPQQLVQAEAQKQSAQADLTRAQFDYDRQHHVDPRATSQQNVDQATAQRQSAQASVRRAQAQVRIAGQVSEQIQRAEATVNERQQQVHQAQAELEQADLNLSYTVIKAPSDGFVTNRNIQQGSLLQQGQSMFSLVTPEVWITANFKETQLDRMRIGDEVDVEVDAYSGLDLHGHVDSIQQGSGSRFSAFPAENATGNFVKIVQRIPVKIVIDRGLDPNRPLPLGLSVTPKVYLK